MLGHIARIIVAMVVAGAVILGTSIAAGWYHYNTSGPLPQETTIILKRGTAFRQTVHILYRQQVIKHPLLFILTAVALQQSQNIKAGEYRFAAHSSVRSILEKLTTGDTVIRRVTFPEGLTTHEIFAIVNATEGLEGEITEVVKEGTLLPETYHFSYGDSRNDIIRRMQRDMQKTLSALWEKRQPGLPLATPEEALTLASIVEKETGVKAERPRVAAVFINRLRKNMPLQSDPTVIYAMTLGKGTLDRPLTYADLKTVSPYNTYVVQGLPPHPIAHPGKASIEAVLQPLQTKELYFVADGKGGHNFAETLQGHNRNVILFRNKMKNLSRPQ